MDNNKINVLFTAAGGAGTIYMIKHLKKMKRFRIVAVDANRYAAGLHFADKAYVVPMIGSENYINKILEIVTNEDIDVAVPLIDEELSLFFKFEEKVEKLKVLIPKKRFTDIVLNKLRMVEEFSKKNIPVPESYSFSDMNSKIKMPFIIKPRVSRGSRGFRIIREKAEIEKYLNEEKYAKEELMVQKYIEGKEYTVSVIITKEGKLLSVVPKEIILKRGITQIGITRKNRIIENLCKKINEKFNPCGPINVQLIIDEKGKPYVFEVNPRFSTTVALTIESGVDEISALILDRLDEKFNIEKKFKENLIMTRYSEQLFVEEKADVI
jgi:carbamoyl-phosphate synthase large subunit